MVEEPKPRRMRGEEIPCQPGARAFHVEHYAQFGMRALGRARGQPGVPHIGQLVIAEAPYLVGCQLSDVHVLAPISLKCSN